MRGGYEARSPLTEKAGVHVIRERFSREMPWYGHCSA
jgi:hypothetical protein